LGPEGGRPGSDGRLTQAVRHTCSGKLGIVKILRFIRSDIVKKIFAGRCPLANGDLCLRTPKHNGKSGTACLSLRYNKEEKNKVMKGSVPDLGQMRVVWCEDLYRYDGVPIS
jgi:hypothetical protein